MSSAMAKPVVGDCMRSLHGTNEDGIVGPAETGIIPLNSRQSSLSSTRSEVSVAHVVSDRFGI